MSDSNSSHWDTDSPNPLIQNLRQFRYEKRRPLSKMSTSEEDSNTSSDMPVRRKPTNRIEDSDSDASSIALSEENLKQTKDEKLSELKKRNPGINVLKLHNALNKNNWDVEEADKTLNEVISVESNNSVESPLKRKNNSPHNRKIKKAKTINYEEDNDEADSDEISYSEKIYDSDDDDDLENIDELTDCKTKVLEFLQEALPTELILLHNCSQKKVNAILECRPFLDWPDLVKKLRKSKFLDLEILNNVQSFLETRKVLRKIMKKCMQISNKIETAVASGGSKITEQPSSLNKNFKLTSYQMVGLNWFVILHANKVNGILADEMGLGKTIQVIAFLTYLKEMGYCQDGPHLIVVPASTMENWMNELERWSPGLKVEQYYGSQLDRKEIRMDWRKGGLDDVDVILTTYNLVCNTPEERKLFRVLPIQYVIFDEAHMLKNMTTIRFENLIRIGAKHRILLTGTPLQNNLVELMSLLLFVMPSLFAGIQGQMKLLFSKNLKVYGDKNVNKPQFEEEQVMNAKKVMKPFVLRRLKSEVLKDLPKKTVETIFVPMSEKQEQMYKNCIAEFSKQAGHNEEINTLSMMTQLRKLANHPLLHQNFYTEDKLQIIAQRLAKEQGYKQKNPDYVFEELLWMSDYQINELTHKFKSIVGFGLPSHLFPLSGKFEKLDELLPKLKEEGHRVLIFSQFTTMLDIMEEYLAMRQHSFLRLDGNTAVTERQDLIDEYTSDTSIFIFLLSTKAGGLGINLTSADTVIIHDIDFNPYNDKQAEDRCHRVGQTKPVTIIRFLSKDTIEEGMFEIAKEKLKLEKQVTEEEEGDSTGKKSVLKLLKATLGLDANHKFNNSALKNGSTENGFGDLDEEENLD